MDPGQHYNLQIIGCRQPNNHKATVSTNDTGSIFIPPPSFAQQYAPAVVASGQTPHTLYSLRGPAGKGIYQLQTPSSPEVRGFGSSVLHDGWYTHSEGEYIFLRHKGLDSGFWIAVPEQSDNATTWEMWWLQPSGVTVEDFEDYVMVDIEVVKVEETGRQKEL